MTVQRRKYVTFRDIGRLHDAAAEKLDTGYTRATEPVAEPSPTTPDRPTLSDVISPTSDFQKIPNSITREAVPGGLFRGKSKLVYDYLWSESRGAINPSRFVKKSRREIMRQTAIGSMVTVDAAVAHLEKVGLIRIDRTVGSSSGNGYEIYAPEELTYTSSASTTSTTSLTQKVDVLVLPESSISSITQPIDSIDTYGRPKTSFKTNDLNDDDYALRAGIDSLRKAAKRTTGRELAKNDIGALTELIKIFISETDAAADHTERVTDYISFGLENLRRRLKAKPVKHHKPLPKNVRLGYWAVVEEEEPTTDDATVAEPPEPLSETARENALVILRGMLRTAPIEDLQTLAVNYTKQDWEWLMENLKRK